MSTINDGGVACSRCGLPAVRKQGHQFLCGKHYRFGQMRALARKRGKLVPSHEELHSMAGSDLCCPDCTGAMNWLAIEGQSSVASLQHYRDGSLAIVCRSCNTRHAFMPGDSYRDSPKDHKHCPKCQATKPFTEFSKDSGRSGPMKLKSSCKSCSSKSHTEWQRNNRDHYNAKQREGRANRSST